MAGTTNARADDRARGGRDIEHTINIGIGGAAEIELGDGGAFHPGGNLMLEWDAVENWLELELEASLIAADHGVEVPVGLLFKKPFRLARWAEFMVGIGPEVVRVLNPTTKATYFGGQAALDFMFWPSQHFGLWIEPSYDLTYRGKLSLSAGSTGGVLFGW